MRRRGKSPWLEAERNKPLQAMLPCVAERIAGGENPLEVWCQQQCVPMRTLARRAGIGMSRLLDVAHGYSSFHPDELEAVAKELRLVPRLLDPATARAEET